MINWNFPPNNYGQITGLNDAGIETFKGSPLDSLAREINQNSCDAKDPNNPNPVEVHFNLFEISPEEFPGIDEFKIILESCLEYWKGNEKAELFFNNAISIISSDKIPVLKISDYNTTGLIGATQENRGGWHNLIKAVGSSDKGSQSGGSFGIGKHAPFACSDLRTVFYGTRDLETKLFAFQGVSKLVTHKNNDGEPTQGTGYFGVIDKNKPIFNPEQVNPIFNREEIGTDLFIAGFIKTNDWEEKIIKSVLENFFVAILDEKLIVKIGDVDINSFTLPEMLEKYTKNDPECYSYKYYESYMLSSRSYFREDNFCDMGELELYVLPGDDSPKRVAMVRSTGMKIYDKDKFRTPFKFAGVLIAKGEKLNDFLRKIEPPTHNAWEPDRHEDPETAKKVIKSLYAWLNEKIRSLSLLESTDELDVEGLSQYLPDHGDEKYLSHDVDKTSNSEGEKNKARDIEIETNYSRNKPFKHSGGVEGTKSGNEIAAGSEMDGELDSEDFGSYGENPGSNSNTKGRRVGDEDFSGRGQSIGENADNSSYGNSVEMLRYRVFCINPDTGSYKVSLQTNENGTGYLSLKIIGEVGGERATVRSVTDQQTGEKYEICSNGRFGPIKFDKNGRYELIVTLNESIRCALEVNLYAD